MQGGAHIFLTGVTGFVGKVVLEELFRRGDPLNVERVYVLIRPSHKGSAQERFDKVANSPCFSRLAPGWARKVQVMSGELTHPGCGLSARDRHHLSDHVTHVINCAASVEFDLPVVAAARANVTTSLEALALARACRNLTSMVSVSTAYVTPHADGQSVPEQLVRLPRSAESMYRSAVGGKVRGGKLLAETGHPNTYTLTKCISEHLLLEQRGHVPLTIVRPSIISVCWRHPFPSWIDSRAAFAGFVALYGAGYLRALAVDPMKSLDIMPCDEVASRIIDSAFDPPQGAVIRHAVAGARRSILIGDCVAAAEDFFSHSPFAYVGTRDLRFLLKELQHHTLPLSLASLWHTLRGDVKMSGRVRRLLKSLHYINAGFTYFTHRTFDFRSTMPLEDAQFRGETYLPLVCEGVQRHLLDDPNKSRQGAPAPDPQLTPGRS